VRFTHYSQLNLLKGASESEAPTTLTAQDLVNVANAVWDEVLDDGVEAREMMKVISSVLVGKVSGLPNGPQFLSIGGTKVRVSADTDKFGNRTRVTFDYT